jgi:hypothetical protein
MPKNHPLDREKTPILFSVKQLRRPGEVHRHPPGAGIVFAAAG